jgi:hypothetical protein
MPARACIYHESDPDQLGKLHYSACIRVMVTCKSKPLVTIASMQGGFNEFLRAVCDDVSWHSNEPLRVWTGNNESG